MRVRLCVAAVRLAVLAVMCSSSLEGAENATSAWTETPKRVLALRLDYTPSQGTPYTQQELEADLLICSNAVREMSYGKTWLEPTVTTTVLVLPGSKVNYQRGADYTRDAIKAAAAVGYDVDDYDICIYSLPWVQGLGTRGAGSSIQLNGRVSPWTIVHEVGHCYGLSHANFWLGVTGNGLIGHHCADNPSLFVEDDEYGDIFDFMGVANRAVEGQTPVEPNGHFSMPKKACLNWIEDAEVTDVTGSGVYRIYRFDHEDARSVPGHALALRIDLHGLGQLWVGFRRNFPDNPSLSTGAYIVWTPVSMKGQAGGLHRLLDTTPLSRPNEPLDKDKEDAALAPNKTYTDPSGTVQITNLGWGGTAPYEYLDLDVTLLNPNPAIELTGPDGEPLQLPRGTGPVQWDGVAVVQRPVQMALSAAVEGCMYVDLNGDGLFDITGPEVVRPPYGCSPVVPCGTYHIRIQYMRNDGENSLPLVSNQVQFATYTSADLTTAGLTGSYVNQSLRSYATQDDWRLSQTISGSRIDLPGFTSMNWVNRAAVGVTDGSQVDSYNFSVQWDGYLRVFQPMRFTTISTDGSRLWIDLNGDGSFDSTGSEFIDNHWGQKQDWTTGPLSTIVAPGVYRLRIQYETTVGKNRFILAAVPATSEAD